MPTTTRELSADAVRATPLMVDFASTATRVRDDPKLLSMMLDDMGRQDTVWQPQGGWRHYGERIVRELRRAGLTGFRTNQRVLKGFAAGGPYFPYPPRGAARRWLWEATQRLPGLRAVFAQQQTLLQAARDQAVAAERSFAREVLERIAAEFPALKPPNGLANGGADDAFLWRGHEISAAWVQYLCRAADLYHSLSSEPITRLLEIGPGLAFSTLAHAALNPNLRVVVNVDIPPILYVSTQFLKSFPEFEVVDYRDTRTAAAIEIDGGSNGRVRIYQLAPWQIARISGSVDVALNAASFNEMEQGVVARYADQCGRLARRAVLLHMGIPGSEAREAGPPVPNRFILDRFSGAFPNAEILEAGWCDLYAFHGTYKLCPPGGYAAILLRRAA